MERKKFVFMLIGICSMLVGAGTFAALAQDSYPPVQPAFELGEPGTSFGYETSLGTLGEPYIADSEHLNSPSGLFIDSSDAIYVVEEKGYRWLQYDASGQNQLTIGWAGVCASEDYAFCTLTDIVTDPGGNIWVMDGFRAVQYDPTGVFLQQFPIDWSDPNLEFAGARGLAFDGNDHLFISDTGHQRIQVFDISGATPVYSATIGVTDVISQTAGYFNWPSRIAIDSADRLYVADTGNGRVQRCVYSGTWACTEFDTGLDNPFGVATDASDNLFIAQNSGSIRKCSPGGACSDFASALYSFHDIAVDSLGNVYASAPYEDVIVQFEADGTLVGIYLGEEFVPYLTSGAHFNRPRVAIDPQNNLIVSEEAGQRLLKFSPNGTFLWSAGTPGVEAYDNEHFNYPRAVATDQAGNIYVGDGNRVQIFTPEGIYSATLGTGYGTGDYEFSETSGVAVDHAGKIYVSDCSNHRVQIYDHNLAYLDTLGELGVTGDDAYHFDCPRGIEVDATGSLYVADEWNCRVQKYDSNLNYLMTFGTTGSCTEQHSDVNAQDVTVDEAGRVYVSGWKRVQVFDASGAYLTTIGGAWGTHAAQFKGALGVAVDGFGNVYVADYENARIQKFSLDVPHWKQVNINGFGSPSTGVSALQVFNNQLYAAASDWQVGARVWRSSDGVNWASVSEFGFSSTYGEANPAIPDLIEYNGQLYASTAWGNSPAQIWRSSIGTIWNSAVSNGFGNPNNTAITRFASFGGLLYAATGNEVEGSEIWRTSTGNPGSWSKVFSNGDGNPNNKVINTFERFGGYLYAASENEVDGAHIWRTINGTLWEPVIINGFGDPHNIHIGSLQIFNNMLYAGTRNDVTGAQLWYSSNGTIWQPIMQNGFGDVANEKIESLFIYKDRLIAVTGNYITGAEVWQSSDGLQWRQIAADGLGDSNNTATLWNSATILFLDQLYIGTWNWANGGELWRYEPDYRINLPLIIR